MTDRNRALQALHDENERLGLYKDAYKQEQGEPVAKVGYKTIGGNVGISTVIYEIYTAGRDPLQAGDLLYTTPQQRKPLTDEQIDKAMAENKQTLIDAADNYWKMRRAYARIIEAAHGIKE